MCLHPIRRLEDQVVIHDLNLNNYVEIAEGIFWVGYADTDASLHCNPYLITDHDEAVLIDSGSRGDFSTVMLKVLRTGTNPRNITRLIYQHYDPDLCGNIPHMESMINNPNLRILSHSQNNIFINYYSAVTSKEDIQSTGLEYIFTSGRKLRFIPTPYSHSPGSFVTYDVKTKTLFSSDLYGSYDIGWNLYTTITPECCRCVPQKNCPKSNTPCEVIGMYDFHKMIMTSNKALHYAIQEIMKLDIVMIAPQHGSIIHSEEAIQSASQLLLTLDGVGIDGVVV